MAVSDYNGSMSKKPRKKKTKRNTSGATGKSRREEYYTAGELFLAGLGVLVLILVAGIIITALVK